MTYKELRSFVKNGRIPFADAQSWVAEHLTKTLGITTFRHAESQKEGIIQMD